MRINTYSVSHQEIARIALAAAIISVFGGCNNSSTEDLLVVSFAPYSSPVKIDTVCEDGECASKEKLTVRITFDDDSYVPEDTEASFKQYRVDYEISAISREIPYFASPISVHVTPEHTTTVAVQPVGETQRTFVYETVGDQAVAGTAILILAGYDDQNEIVMVEKSFDISFGTFSDHNSDAVSTKP
jgi:hypothetical protein